MKRAPKEEQKQPLRRTWGRVAKMEGFAPQRRCLMVEEGSIELNVYWKGMTKDMNGGRRCGWARGDQCR